MRLNSSASAPSSSRLEISRRSSSAPEPIFAAAAWIDSIGRTSLRARRTLVTIASAKNATSRTAVRQTVAFSGANASLSGSSTKTRQPVGCTVWNALSTFVPSTSRPIVAVFATPAEGRSAAWTCGREAKLLCPSTRLMSRCANTSPRASTA
jgi:hypothetical protein